VYQKNDGTTRKVLRPTERVGTVVFTGIIQNLSAEEEQSEKIMAILQSAIDPVVQINEQGIIQFVNSACCKVFKYQQSEMVGQNVSMLMPQPHSLLHDSYLQNYCSTGVRKVLGIGRKLRGRRSDRSTFSLHLSLSEARIDGTVFMIPS
jgi:PAS domain S-box-containing protein